MRALVVLTALTLSSLVSAEAWLANRYAQNCAACHAPGRINKPASERRCTLSCQGCHVNPNGGGIRSFYGQWNQKRWLRSTYIDGLLTNKRIPAPFRKQLYANRGGGGNDDDNDEMTVPGTSISAEPDRPGVPPAGFPTRVVEGTDYKDTDYDRSDGQERITAKNKAQFLERVTADDPYRDERRVAVSGGGDLRFQSFFPTSDPGRKPGAWLMNADLGVRVRPVPENFALVMEGRFLAPPTARAFDEGFTSEARVRSAYVMVDDLPYNGYFMAGIYRPMFGMYSPDHDSISNYISGLRQRATYKTVGIGAAPNVPFFNINYITPMTSAGYDRSEGIVANLGLRFVTLGGSIVFSYWNTTQKDPAGDIKRNMIAINTGLALWRFIWNLELLSVKREIGTIASDQGSVYTSQLRYRLWRETYLEFEFANANTSILLTKGTSSELAFGVRTFIIAGVDLSLLYVNRTNKTDSGETKRNDIQFQAHLFF